MALVCDGCGTKTRKGPLSGSCDDCKYTVCEDCACHVECANFELGQGGGPECAGPDCHNRSRSVCKCFSHNFGMSYCDAMTPGLKCYWGAKGGLVYDGLKKCKAQIEMEQRFFQDESLEYIRECSFEGCEAVPKSRCGKCKSVAYCSKRHQIADWKAHKHQCGPHIEPRKAPYVSAEMRAYVERTGRYPRALPEGGIPEEKKDPVKAALERSDGKEVVPEEDGKKLYEKVKRKNRNKKAVREAFSRDVCPPVETGPEVVPLPRSGDRKPHVAPKRDPTANVEWGRPGGRGGGQQQGAGKCIRCGTTHEKLLAGGQGFSIGLACSNCAEFVAADEDTPKVEVVEQMSAEEMFADDPELLQQTAALNVKIIEWLSKRENHEVVVTDMKEFYEAEYSPSARPFTMFGGIQMYANLNKDKFEYIAGAGGAAKLRLKEAAVLAEVREAGDDGGFEL